MSPSIEKLGSLNRMQRELSSPRTGWQMSLHLDRKPKPMLLDEARLEELMVRAVRRVLDERQMVIDADSLSKEQAAKLLGVCTRTITTYMKREGMPHTFRLGRLEFRRDEILTWWRERGNPVPALRSV